MAAVRRRCVRSTMRRFSANLATSRRSRSRRHPRSWRYATITPLQLADAYLSRIGTAQQDLNAFVTVTSDLARSEAQVAERRARSFAAIWASRSRTRICSKPKACAPPRARCSSRITFRRQRGDRAAAGRRRRGDARQDQHSRARRRRHDDQSVLRHHAQPRRSHAHPRRIERRFGRRRCRAPVRGGDRQRHRRQRSHSGGVLRLRRFQTHVRPHQHAGPACASCRRSITSGS